MALKILKSVMEEKINATNVQLATVTAKEGYKLWNEAALEAVITTL